MRIRLSKQHGCLAEEILVIRHSSNWVFCYCDFRDCSLVRCQSSVPEMCSVASGVRSGGAAPATSDHRWPYGGWYGVHSSLRGGRGRWGPSCIWTGALGLKRGGAAAIRVGRQADGRPCQLRVRPKGNGFVNSGGTNRMNHLCPRTGNEYTLVQTEKSCSCCPRTPNGEGAIPMMLQSCSPTNLQALGW